VVSAVASDVKSLLTAIGRATKQMESIVVLQRNPFDTDYTIY